MYESITSTPLLFGHIVSSAGQGGHDVTDSGGCRCDKTVHWMLLPPCELAALCHTQLPLTKNLSGLHDLFVKDAGYRYLCRYGAPPARPVLTSQKRAGMVIRPLFNGDAS